jgi:hypothetical protein
MNLLSIEDCLIDTVIEIVIYDAPDITDPIYMQ